MYFKKQGIRNTFTNLISKISPVLISGTGLSFSAASIALLFNIQTNNSKISITLYHKNHYLGLSSGKEKRRKKNVGIKGRSYSLFLAMKTIKIVIYKFLGEVNHNGDKITSLIVQVDQSLLLVISQVIFKGEFEELLFILYKI